MIVLTVVRFNGAPSSGPSASFDELGGTIGRANNNQLVLPDEDRTISRVHARILFRAGSYSIVDNGTNPVMVNGREIGSGREQVLRPGDEVQIGAYVLAVNDGHAASSNDPFADLFGDGLASAGAAPVAAPRAEPKPVAAPAPLAAKLSPGAIPADWDPFAPDAAASPPPAMHLPGPAAPLADMVRVARSEDSLDDLFGLSAAPKGVDPLARAMPLPAGPANTAAHANPLMSLAQPGTAPPATMGDLGSELNTPMPLPPAARAGMPSGAVFSWDDPLGDLPEAPVHAEPDVRSADAATVPGRLPMPTPAVPAAATPPVVHDALRQALLEGLGAPHLRIDELTPQTMQLIGQLLREATRGAVELLVARAALKREVRAEVTMIVAKENNPLKFSPTADVALQHLLGPPMPGFLPSAAAMRDAFNDLRAHQLGVMAGMRGALDGVLQRFDPVQLESKLEKRSSISNLLPSGRKARLWELFQELFDQLQSEAQDDFEELFGKAFLRAYEQHIDRLRGERGPG